MKRKKRGEKKLSRDYFSDVIEKAQITMRGKKSIEYKRRRSCSNEHPASLALLV